MQHTHFQKAIAPLLTRIFKNDINVHHIKWHIFYSKEILYHKFQIFFVEEVESVVFRTSFIGYKTCIP